MPWSTPLDEQMPVRRGKSALGVVDAAFPSALTRQVGYYCTSGTFCVAPLVTGVLSEPRVLRHWVMTFPFTTSPCADAGASSALQAGVSASSQLQQPYVAPAVLIIGALLTAAAVAQGCVAAFAALRNDD